MAVMQTVLFQAQLFLPYFWAHSVAATLISAGMAAMGSTAVMLARPSS